jgi:hypothetical protein
MKKGQIILGSAAFILSIISAFAFKAHNAKGSGRLVYTSTLSSGNFLCIRVNCWTTTNPSASNICTYNTLGDPHHACNGLYYSTIGGHVCGTPIPPNLRITKVK